MLTDKIYLQEEVPVFHMAVRRSEGPKISLFEEWGPIWSVFSEEGPGKACAGSFLL